MIRDIDLKEISDGKLYEEENYDKTKEHIKRVNKKHSK